ncbi:Nephrocystin-3 [Fibrisoma limi BUZ 3]|uniref:Nephrocystin-3 n=1 Tax=Fibrisoma limi BUZ 3 TaxID=1185876 RepID=I2GT77_9BACT|nr:tetratricopeptide repeat protein [Fibrisoma limi]CCH57106.1 Nephrocystin-3 [Fibrisoma limi BUZ 3]
MEPLSIGLIAQCLTTTKIAECLIGNWLGKGSDHLLSQAGKVIYDRLRTQTQPVNHDIHKAVRDAHLSATLVVCEYLLRTKYNVVDRVFHFPTWDLKEVIRYLKKQRKQLSDVKFILPDSPAVTEYELLLQPKGVSASERLAELQGQLRQGMLQELEKANLGIEDDLRAAILTGWTDKGQPMDWFELLCAFFAESLKTNTRLQSIVHTNLLQEVKELLLTVKANVPQINISPEQLTDLAGQLGKAMQPIVERFDIVIGRLDEMLAILERVEQKVDTVQTGVDQSNESLTGLHEKVDKLIPVPSARHKYLNTFAHYDLQNLVGRQKQLQDIEAHFTNHNLLLLRGMGGIGKTTLARAYLARMEDQFDHVAFLEITGTIADALLLKLGGSKDIFYTQDPQKNTEDNLFALLDVLRHIPNTLLVIDNANDADDLLLRKKAFDSLPWKILITSRAKVHTYQHERKVQEVKQLMPEEARVLFEKLYGLPLTDTEQELVSFILEKAFYHPKLIEVLAKAARENPMLELTTLREIVAKKEYDDEEINYPVEIGEQEKPVYRILLDLFDTDPLDADLKQLLQYFAVLPSIDIPARHLIELLDAEEIEARKTLLDQLKKLTKAGWLDDLDNRNFSMHGLVQWVVQERLKPTLESCHLLINRIGWLTYTESGDNPLDKKQYLPLADSLFSVFGEDSDATLATAYGNTAVVYGALGDNQKRLEYDLKALSIREQTLAPTHPDLASSYANIAVTYGALGDNQQALEYDLKALSIREQTLAPTHPDLAFSYANIAVTYYSTGDLSKALTHMQKATQIREQVLPATHPDLLQSKADLTFLEQALQERNKTAG